MISSLLIIIFLLSVYFLSSKVQSLVNHGLKKVYNVDDGSNTVRVVKILNQFSHDISAYYEVNDLNGIYLTNVAPNEELQLSTANGHVIYATDPEGYERIAVVSINPSIDHYSFHPLTEDIPTDYDAHEDHSDSFVHSSKDPVITDKTGRELKHHLNIEHRERQHPAVRKLLPHERASTALSAKFRSLSGRSIDLWYDDHQGGTIQAHLGPGQETTTNTYVGHEFFATYAHDPRKKEIFRFRISANKALYVIDDKEHPASDDIIQQSNREEAFMEAYYNRTEIHWRHYYGDEGPRPPPQSFMWPGVAVGDVHAVEITAGHWTCDEKNHCEPSSEVQRFELEVISTTPRAFVIPNFINDLEIEEVKRLATPRLHISQVGDLSAGVFESKTRTSKNAWVGKNESPIITNLYTRASQLLRIPQDVLDQNVEDLQVVHYNVGEKYDAHHDWGVSGVPESRFLTLLLYMNDKLDDGAGGDTSFPKDGKGGGIKVHPGKGHAVLFYDLLEDGNGDDLALHAAMPVLRGEKWLCNFWVWDPHK